MLERIGHRGPDDRGEIQVADAWLGHTRLSIVDVESGHQPLHTSDKQLWMVGNGEVYNHQNVRERLSPRHRVRHQVRQRGGPPRGPRARAPRR